MRTLRLGLAAILATPVLTVAGVPGASASSAINPHSATFTGPYVASYPHTNYASSCNDGSVSLVRTCAMWFATPSSYKHMCVANATAKATTGYWAPLAADPSKSIGVDLFWTGGGVLEGTVIIPGTPAAYVMHIQLVDACGDMPSTLDDVLSSMDIGLGLGALLAPNYKFTGYVNAV